MEKYEGILQTDGWQVYDKFKDMRGVTLVGCLVLARRYFDKALKTNKSKCEEALTIIQRIYAEERLCKEMATEDRKVYRDQHIHPVFEELCQWIDADEE